MEFRVIQIPPISEAEREKLRRQAERETQARKKSARKAKYKKPGLWSGKKK